VNVSEIARKAGTTAKTVRFYEAAGIIPAARRSGNGYREYDEQDLCQLRLVTTLRELGLSLANSGRLAGLCCSQGRCHDMEGELLGLVRERRAAIAATRAEIDHLEHELAALETALVSGERPHRLCERKEVS
jgi:MerR family copper efflux transcriptional regulator